MPILLKTPGYNIEQSYHYIFENNTDKVEVVNFLKSADTSEINKINKILPFDINTYKIKCLTYEISDLNAEFNHFLIVPTYKQSQSIDKEICRDYYNLHSKPSIDFNIFGFNNFISFLADVFLEKGKYILLEEKLQLALIEIVLSKFDSGEEGGKLKYYKPELLKVNPDSYVLIKKSINGLRKKGITANKLKQDYEKYNKVIKEFKDGERFFPSITEDNGSNGFEVDELNINLVSNPLKLHDFIEILSEYEKLLGDKFLDYHNVIEILVKTIITNKDYLFGLLNGGELANNSGLSSADKRLMQLLGSNFLFYGFTNFELPEIKLLDTLKNVGFNTCIHFDALQTNSALFNTLSVNIGEVLNYGKKEESLNHFERREFELYSNLKEGFDDSNQNQEQKTVINPEVFVKKYLFNPVNNSHISPALYYNTQVFQTPNKFLEVEYITYLCKYLLSNKELGLEPSDIVIQSRSPSKYADIFREIGLKNNIVFNVSDRFSLKSSRLISELMLFFEALQNNFSISSKENYFSKLSHLSYFDFNRKNLQFIAGNTLFKGKQILFAPPNTHIIDHLIELWGKEYAAECDADVAPNVSTSNLGGCAERRHSDKSNTSKAQKVAKLIDAVLLTINEFNVFPQQDANFKEKPLAIRKVDKQCYEEISEKYRYAKDDQYFIKFFDFKVYFEEEFSCQGFTDIIKATIKKFRLLDSVVNFRNKIIDSKINLDLSDLLDDFDWDESERDVEVRTDETQEANYMSDRLIQKFIHEVKPNLYENVENDIKALRHLNLSLGDLQKISHTIYNSEDFGFNKESDQQVTLKFSKWFSELKHIISNTRYQINDRFNTSIQVTSIEQTRGVDYKVSILCGVVAGEFPMNFATDTVVGKELEKSQEKFYANEKLLLYQFFLNGLAHIKENKKLFFIFYPEYKDNQKLVRSVFLDDTLSFLEKASGEKIEGIREKMIFPLNSQNLNLSDPEYIQFLETNGNGYVNNKNPFLTKWVDSLRNVNIYKGLVNAESYDLFIKPVVSIDTMEQFFPFVKKKYLERDSFKVSNFSYFVTNFASEKEGTGGYGNEELPSFSNKVSTFVQSILKLSGIDENPKYSLEKKEQGTIFHNSIESLVSILSQKNLNYSIKQQHNAETSSNFSPQGAIKLIGFVEESSEEERKQNFDKIVFGEVQDNTQQLLEGKTLKDIDLVNYIAYFIQERLLRTFPRTIYINFAFKYYIRVAELFVSALLGLSENHNNILFSELDLCSSEEFSVGENNLPLRMKFSGRSDLIFLKEADNGDGKGNNLSFGIYDMKFKKLEKNENDTQLYLYHCALRRVLDSNNILSQIEELCKFFLLSQEKDGTVSYTNYFESKKTGKNKNENDPANDFFVKSKEQIEIALTKFINDKIEV